MSQFRLKGLSKRFGTHETLSDISLEVKKSEVITVIGPSGSGKTTLLRCANLLERPTRGEIFVGNEQLRLEKGRSGDLEAIDRKQLCRLRAKMPMIFQGYHLWTHRTAIENVVEAQIHVLGVPREQAFERARFYLDKLGLNSRIDYYPSRLSGGQQQRVAIARALAMEPEILLFDEPTSGLDPELVRGLADLLIELKKEGRSMVVVTHEMSFAQAISSEVIFLHSGKVEERGSPDQILIQPKSERLRSFLNGTSQ